MKQAPILVNTLELLGVIQRCAKHAAERKDERLGAAVDTVLSALVAANGLRNASASLPGEVRPYHKLVTLKASKM